MKKFFALLYHRIIRNTTILFSAFPTLTSLASIARGCLPPFLPEILLNFVDGTAKNAEYAPYSRQDAADYINQWLPSTDFEELSLMRQPLFSFARPRASGGIGRRVPPKLDYELIPLFCVFHCLIRAAVRMLHIAYDQV